MNITGFGIGDHYNGISEINGINIEQYMCVNLPPNECRAIIYYIIFVICTMPAT